MTRASPILALALLAGGCETAFVGDAPAGRYELAQVDGQAVPGARDGSSPACRPVWDSGYLDIDQLARRFELHARQRDACTGAPVREVRERGSYLRRGGQMTLESEDAARRWTASFGGRSITIAYGEHRLRFSQRARP